jgi:hypothetical protein
MEFVQYLMAVKRALDAHPEWRVGQTFFNVLYDLRPDCANAIRGTALDPFHRDRVLASFLICVEQTGDWD